jgi:hypothetical protein
MPRVAMGAAPGRPNQIVTFSNLDEFKCTLCAVDGPSFASAGVRKNYVEQARALLTAAAHRLHCQMVTNLALT